MDKSAIDLLQNTAIAAHATMVPSTLANRLVARPSDFVIEDLEKFADSRARFRGTLLTDSIADFVAYVKRHATEAPVVVGPNQKGVPGFIDADKLSATVHFNLGTAEKPGHGDDTAVLRLKSSAPYAALTAVNGRQLQHKDAIDWLEDWSELVEYRSESGEAISAAAALASIRKITIRATAETTSSQENFRATRSALEDVEARGAQSLPAEIAFSCTPFAGLPERTFRLRLAVLTSTDKPVLVFRVRNFESEKEAIAQDFKRVLLTDLEGAADLTIGQFTP